MRNGNEISLDERYKELHDVIHKVSTGKWHIRGHHGDWKSEYDTKTEAENALKAYYASKH